MESTRSILNGSMMLRKTARVISPDTEQEKWGEASRKSMALTIMRLSAKWLDLSPGASY